MQGTQNHLGYLPQTVSNSDFIFSVIAEETGFLGAISILTMYILLMISIFRTALNAPDDFGRYLCAGLGAMFAIHSIVNIGMTIRMMPVTGLPLPLISYGGTFMVMALFSLGMIQSVYARRIIPDPEL
jgi:rod shape determining protein RodA